METTIRYEIGCLDAECIKDMHAYSCHRCGGPVTTTEGGVVYTMDENHYLEGELIDQRLLGLLCLSCGRSREAAKLTNGGNNMVEIVYVMNPWTRIYHATTRKDVTPDKLAAMAVLMEDEIREDLDREFMDDPFAFWAAYVDRVGAEEAGRLWFS